MVFCRCHWLEESSCPIQRPREADVFDHFMISLPKISSLMILEHAIISKLGILLMILQAWSEISRQIGRERKQILISLPKISSYWYTKSPWQPGDMINIGKDEFNQEAWSTSPNKHNAHVHVSDRKHICSNKLQHECYRWSCCWGVLGFESGVVPGLSDFVNFFAVDTIACAVFSVRSNTASMALSIIAAWCFGGGGFLWESSDSSKGWEVCCVVSVDIVLFHVVLCTPFNSLESWRLVRWSIACCA